MLRLTVWYRKGYKPPLDRNGRTAYRDTLFGVSYRDVWPCKQCDGSGVTEFTAPDDPRGCKACDETGVANMGDGETLLGSLPYLQVRRTYRSVPDAADTFIPEVLLTLLPRLHLTAGAAGATLLELGKPFPIAASQLLDAAASLSQRLEDGDLHSAREEAAGCGYVVGWVEWLFSIGSAAQDAEGGDGSLEPVWLLVEDV